MIITPLGIAFAALFAVCLIGGRSTFVIAIAVSLFFQDSAMFVVGGIGIAPYTAALVVAAALQVVFIVRVRRPGRAARTPIGLLAAGSREGVWLRRALLVLLGYSAVVTAVGPMIFKGVLIMPSQGASDYLVNDLPHLQYTISNAAQIAYLVLNVVVVWYIATLPRVPREALFAAISLVAVVILVAVALHFLHVPWPSAIFDNSPRNYYANPVNDPRLRALFSEPSHLAWFLTLTLAYSVRQVFTGPKYRRFIAAGIVLLCLVCIGLNPSTTIILALAVVGPAAIVVLAHRYRAVLFSRRGWIGITIGVVVLAGVTTILWTPITEFLGPALLGKIGSSSQYSRGKQDLNSLSLLFQSFGAGVGLGSNRSSSLALMLFSDIGVIGTVAYYTVIVLSIVILFKRGSSAEAWALTALAVACAISVADFVSPPTWFLIGIAAQLSRPAARFGGVHRAPVSARRIPALTGAGR